MRTDTSRRGNAQNTQSTETFVHAAHYCGLLVGHDRMERHDDSGRRLRGVIDVEKEIYFVIDESVLADYFESRIG